jgi:hypothetical protein
MLQRHVGQDGRQPGSGLPVRPARGRWVRCASACASGNDGHGRSFFFVPTSYLPYFLKRLKPTCSRTCLTSLEEVITMAAGAPVSEGVSAV